MTLEKGYKDKLSSYYLANFEGIYKIERFERKLFKSLLAGGGLLKRKANNLRKNR